ncbi:hypothetical protein NMY22_g19115 [Coprinellus aureogranulatus]|nr:hypothetical protein NMY22_g19115 [Coprinellus aureogranulatus]
MEYRPRYAQPFTLREAVGLDIEIINEGRPTAVPLAEVLTVQSEIARLQNSLDKLNDTQAQLREFIQQSREGSEEPDAEIVKALEDNIDVIGAQEERISILKMALSEKGVDTSSVHYSIPKQESRQAATTTEERPIGESNDEGVYL